MKNKFRYNLGTLRVSLFNDLDHIEEDRFILLVRDKNGWIYNSSDTDKSKLIRKFLIWLESEVEK